MDYDVIVVGGGPGGSSTAIFLAKKGYTVLLVDKASFPRDKTCGDAISGKSAKQLQKLGLIDDIEALPSARIGGVLLSSPNGRILDVPVPQGFGVDNGYCCKRELYDNMLFAAAKKESKIKTIENFNVTRLLKEGERIVGIAGTAKGSPDVAEFRAKIVVGADGAHSIVAKGIGTHDLDPKHTAVAARAYYEGVTGLTDRIEIHFIPEVLPGYFWIFPVGEGNANIGIGMLMSDAQKKGFNMVDRMYAVVKANPLFSDRFKDAKLVENTTKGWILPMGSKLRKMYGEGTVLVGDAAALIDPFSGEGIGNAMTSAELAAETIDNAFKKNDFSASFLASYQRNVEKLLAAELHVSYRLQQTLNHPWLINFAFGKAVESEKLRHYLSMSLVKPEAMAEISGPMFYVRLLFS